MNLSAKPVNTTMWTLGVSWWGTMLRLILSAWHGRGQTSYLIIKDSLMSQKGVTLLEKGKV